MKIDRYDLPISPWDHTATSDFGNWCRSDDVARLEASHAELLEALKSFVSTYGNPDVRRWMAVRDQARAAVAKAEGEAA